MFKTPILMLKMTFFLLLFRGKFEQKTQKSISFKNQWRLKNIKKAMVVKNIIAEDMPFTKSIFEQFWRSYCKKTIFVVFHFLKFLPFCLSSSVRLPFCVQFSLLFTLSVLFPCQSSSPHFASLSMNSVLVLCAIVDKLEFVVLYIVFEEKKTFVVDFCDGKR